jgi:L-iditol 2-dehydrogenase
VLGHEIAGRLEDGSRVTVLHRVPCGVCERCRAGHESTCEAFAHVRIAPGGFAERLRATHCLPLPDALGDRDGVWVEPLACVLRAAERIPAGARVLVAGCGAIGRLWTQVLRLRGHEVLAADPRPDRLDGVRALGAGVDAGPVDAAVLTAAPGIGSCASWAHGRPRRPRLRRRSSCSRRSRSRRWWSCRWSGSPRAWSCTAAVRP